MALSYYRALLVQDKGDGPDSGYGVVFPDLPGCTSGGETQQKAARQAADALAAHIGLLLEDGEAMPETSDLGAALPDWLTDAGRIAGEVLVPVEVPGRAARAKITREEVLLHRER